MKGVLPIKVFFIVIVFVSSFYGLALAQEDGAIDSVDGLKGCINKIQKYDVDLNVKKYLSALQSVMEFDQKDKDTEKYMEINTKVYGESGRKLRIETSMGNPNVGIETGMKLIFDGQWLWVEQELKNHPQMAQILQKGFPLVQAMKIHIASVSPDPVNEPFNTVYGVTGSGLYRYKDLPGTFMALIRDYDLSLDTALSDDEHIVFSGEMREHALDAEAERLRKQVRQTNSPEHKIDMEKMVEDLVGNLRKMTRVCLISISRETGLIDSYTVGPTKDSPSQATAVEYVGVNEALPDDIFTYVVPDGIEVRDATADMMKQQAAAQ